MSRFIQNTALADILLEDFTDFDLEKIKIAKMLNAKLYSIDPEGGNAEVHFNISDDYIHGGKLVQGGIISAMLDFAIAMGALAQVEQNMSVGTATLNVEFYRPALPGKFVSKGELINHGKRIIFSSATLYDSKGRKVAGAHATNLIVPLKKEG